LRRYTKAAATIQGQITSGPSSISQEAGKAALALGHKAGAYTRSELSST
jgi:hypothetical protein